MKAKPGAELTPHGLRLKAQRGPPRELPLVSGTLHYWRHPRATWETLLDAHAHLGFAIVETYVPWSVHEIAPGSYDFGSGDPGKDTAHFLSLAHARGLFAIVRPGPHINAEMTGFGYPARILRDLRCLARTARGTPALVPAPPLMFAAPSYASEAFFAEAETWLRAAASVLAPLQYPVGPIVAVQADNENSFFFRTAPFDLDYHDDALTAYRTFLKERYGEIDVLNRTYGMLVSHFREVQPPREFTAQGRQDLPYYLDWAEFKEHLLAQGIERCAATIREAGLDRVPVFHNFPPSESVSPFNVGSLEQSIDIAGVDLYQSRGDYPQLRDRVLTLVAQSRLPYAPEFTSGFAWFAPFLGPADMDFTARAAFALGLKAVNFYMSVDRDRWYGAPIDRRGQAQEPQHSLLAALLADYQGAGLAALPPPRAVAVLRNRAAGRLTALANLLDPVSPLILAGMGIAPEEVCSDSDFGLGDAVQIEAARLVAAVAAELRTARVPLVLGDDEMSLAALQRFPLAVAGSFQLLTAAAEELLLAYVESGGVLVIGPRRPVADGAGAPRTRLIEAIEGARPRKHGGGLRLYPVGKGLIVPVWDAGALGLPEAAAHLARDLELGLPFTVVGEGVEVTMLGTWERGVIGVINPGRDGKSVRLGFGREAAVTLMGMGGRRERIAGTRQLDLQLDGYSVVWAVFGEITSRPGSGTRRGNRGNA